MYRRSNCIIVAVSLWLRRRRVTRRGYVGWRWSDLSWFPHAVYFEKRDYGFKLVQWKPVNKEFKFIPPPIFRGYIKWGDS